MAHVTIAAVPKMAPMVRPTCAPRQLFYVHASSSAIHHASRHGSHHHCERARAKGGKRAGQQRRSHFWLSFGSCATTAMAARYAAREVESKLSVAPRAEQRSSTRSKWSFPSSCDFHTTTQHVPRHLRCLVALVQARRYRSQLIMTMDLESAASSCASGLLVFEVAPVSFCTAQPKYTSASIDVVLSQNAEASFRPCNAVLFRFLHSRTGRCALSRRQNQARSCEELVSLSHNHQCWVKKVETGTAFTNRIETDSSRTVTGRRENSAI